MPQTTHVAGDDSAMKQFREDHTYGIHHKSDTTKGSHSLSYLLTAAMPIAWTASV